MGILVIKSLLFFSCLAIGIYLLSLVLKKWRETGRESDSSLAKHQEFFKTQEQTKIQHSQLEDALENCSYAIRLQAGQLEEFNHKYGKTLQDLEDCIQKLDEKFLQLENRIHRLENEYHGARDGRKKFEQNRPEQESQEQQELQHRLYEDGSAVSVEAPPVVALEVDTPYAKPPFEIISPETDSLQQTETGGVPEAIEAQPFAQISEEISQGSLRSEIGSEKNNHDATPAARGGTSLGMVNRNRIDPSKRGGGRTSSVQPISRPESFATKRSIPKAGIICRKRERSWVVSVEIAREEIENRVISIQQGGRALLRNDYREDCWDLNSLFSEVNVQVAQESESIAFTEKGYLLFKLGVQNENLGRLVKSLSPGSYLAVAPKDWERDITISGPAQISPEPVFHFDDYRAHFFVLGKNASPAIAFRDSR